ncbi:bacterial bifunctional deaminase-reductase [Pluteus cervinus]|uniref:Bacterial bifunctional deaminase-reductase n=1 Tax=Pluteus cervinus TaxID=181527 RepID=A0ACD3BHD9_9AGAR|nr:bacterial bifunctional deaminase-reductase [Pluteus cervinus]
MSALEFLSTIFVGYSEATKPARRPHVTLTFAQSIDAKIAGKNGTQLILSGQESMVMTHWFVMRTMHDAILIGIGTALNDDPQLNARHLPTRSPDPITNGHNNSYHLPRPVILDTQLRLSPTCKLVSNYKAGGGRRPWVVCAKEDQQGWRDRRDALHEAGVTILEVDITGKLSIPTVLHKLDELGIKSLMVEGGSQVIASFFTADSSNERVIDTVIATIAPVFVGNDGVDYEVNFQEVRTQVQSHDSLKYCF